MEEKIRQNNGMCRVNSGIVLIGVKYDFFSQEEAKGPEGEGLIFSHHTVHPADSRIQKWD